jgi:hypothetical protein
LSLSENVAFSAPVVEGVNVKVMMQFASGATLPLQGGLVGLVKSAGLVPVIVKLVMVRVVLALTFVRVTFLFAGVPFVTVPKFTLFAENSTMVPVPFRVVFSVPSPVTTLSVAVSAPAIEGVKVML